MVDADEFLATPYDVSGDSSAAALVNYLLNTTIDEHFEPEPEPVHHSERRFRSNSGGQYFMQRRYKVGEIVSVAAEVASIEFRTGKSSVGWAQFDREAYHPNGRPARDLRREFQIGDWVAFMSVLNQEYGRRHWRVAEVRKKTEMKRGYGRFRPLGEVHTAGIIDARYKCEAGGGDVFFPGAAFREDGVLLQSLKQGQWLYYYAFDQKPSAGCTATAVEVFSATASGIIVKVSVYS